MTRFLSCILQLKTGMKRKKEHLVPLFVFEISLSVSHY